MSSHEDRYAWRPAESLPLRQDAELQFADIVRELGGVLGGHHRLRLDGHPHRLPAEGDHRGGRAMFYVAHFDGTVPWGYVKNHRTGEERRWVARGYTLTEQQRADLRAQRAQERFARARERQQSHDRTAAYARALINKLEPVQTPTPYMLAKGLAVQRGIFTDDGVRTYVPVSDAAGRLWTMQVIQADGTKRFLKGGKKTAGFHAVGGLEALDSAPVLVIAEGYATAATLAELQQQPAIAAFDAGNLKPAAEALRRRFPDKPILVVGDDDVALEQNPHVRRNVGREQAESAARAVGGRCLLPIFAPGEQQANPKRYSDFNDLATHSALGREGARRQIRSAYEEALSQARVRRHSPRNPMVRHGRRRGRHA